MRIPLDIPIAGVFSKRSGRTTSSGEDNRRARFPLPTCGSAGEDPESSGQVVVRGCVAEWCRKYLQNQEQSGTGLGALRAMVPWLAEQALGSVVAVVHGDIQVDYDKMSRFSGHFRESETAFGYLLTMQKIQTKRSVSNYGLEAPKFEQAFWSSPDGAVKLWYDLGTVEKVYLRAFDRALKQSQRRKCAQMRVVAMPCNFVQLGFRRDLPKFRDVLVQEEKLCQPVVWMTIRAANTPIRLKVLSKDDDF
eukprot:2182162-Pleurochrysis_carterae.AAC.2